MKRLLALFMALIILFTSIGGAAAETLRLPKTLKQIEEETFALTASVEEVDIPFGTEAINSRAFAGSGLSKIYIPSTVYSIAPDAFGSRDLTIVTPDGTFAKEFADEHGYAWEDGSAHYKLDTLQAAKDFLESEEEFTLMLEETEITLISTEGIMDEVQLAAINEINQKLLSYEKLAKEYAASMDSLTDAFSSLADELASASVIQQEDQVSFGLGSALYTISGDALGSIGSDYEIVSAEQTEDGTGVITEVTSGGKTYYLISSANGTVVSSSKAAAIQLAARGETDDNTLIAVVEDFLGRLSYCSFPVAQGIQKIKELAKNMLWDAIDTNTLIKDPSHAHLVPEEVFLDAEERLEFAKKLWDGARRAEEIWRKLNIIGTISGIWSCIKKFHELDQFVAHDHPIPGIALDEQRKELIDQMNKQISSAKHLYVCNGILSTIDLASSMACTITVIARFIPPLTGPASLLHMMSNSVKASLAMYASQSAASLTADSEFNAVKEADSKLHSFVYGSIIDAKTNEPLPDVAVTNGSMTALSDENGDYKIYLFPESHTLLFRKNNYENNGFVVSLSPKQELKQDIALTRLPSGAMVHGTVTSQKDGEPLEGVQVTFGEQETCTDADGRYRFDEVEAGSCAVSFYKPGFARWEDTLEFMKDQELELNIVLADCYVIKTREDLEDVAKDLMGNFVLGNDIDLSGEPWTPLPWFSGTFDGAGYSIDGMHIDAATEDNSGLFIGLYNGHVYNLKMSGVDVDIDAATSFAAIGSICGSLNNQSSLLNCTVTGKVSVTSAESNRDLFAGGLAGISDLGYITDCYSGVDVSVVTPNSVHAGGLTGILNNGEAKNSYAVGDVTATQSGSNASAFLKAFGTLYSASSLADTCHADGSVTASSTNGTALAVGVSRSINSMNLASVSATTENGSATAIGYQEGNNGINKGSVLATAAGSGSATAFGFDKVDVGKNDGSVTARTVSGYALAIGCENTGSRVTNNGNVAAQSISGGANANGLRGADSDSTGCKNSGSVSANGVTNQALAIGVYGCTSSENTGSVTVVSSKGTAVGQGMTMCTDSANYGNVYVTYEGADNVRGSMSAQGLNTCASSTNIGNVIGEVKASTTVCTATGVSGGSGNVNNGAVRATSPSGLANARGVYASNSQNYADIYACSTANSEGDHNSATAYGIGPGYTNSFNGGSVTAVSENGSAYAYGTGGGSGCSSTGQVLAVTNHFISGSDLIVLGNACAYNSTNVQANVAGYSVSASDGNAMNLYYFAAWPNCPYHCEMERKFVTYPQGSSPNNPYGCFCYCGTVDSE